MTPDGSLRRPWRTIAQELARETSSKRIVELSEELTKAMEAQGMDSPPISEAPPTTDGYG